uniref:Uncharacterized protein n=1 Tax=Arundo donax TaxID=35708 RepID=A0A0A9C202_ARUDO
MTMTRVCCGFKLIHPPYHFIFRLKQRCVIYNKVLWLLLRFF